jgi:2-C-methyl-D-erythritol 4-phosphate cytidylyltransferase
LHKQAYRQPFNEGFTDDASVVEAYWLKTPLQLPRGGESETASQEASPRGGLEGVGITLVEGNRENIKITTPFDLIVAEALVSSQEKSGKGTHV